jgi:NH3-dependent NAD+ synthetase
MDFRVLSTHPKIKSLVVGISGGIDSSVVSTLCSLTGMPTYVVGMPSTNLRIRNLFLMLMVNGYVKALTM